jgi:hypothetical protein
MAIFYYTSLHHLSYISYITNELVLWNAEKLFELAFLSFMLKWGTKYANKANRYIDCSCLQMIWYAGITWFALHSNQIKLMNEIIIHTIKFRAGFHRACRKLVLTRWIIRSDSGSEWSGSTWYDFLSVTVLFCGITCMFPIPDIVMHVFYLIGRHLISISSSNEILRL